MDEVDEPLGRNHDFKALLSTQGVSSIGDAVSFTALPLLVFALTGSGAAMGLVGALQTLPDLFLGMFAGALADRSDRKRMMFLADVGRALLTALIPISVWLGGPTLVIIFIVAAPMSILRSFFLAGYTASVPAIVGRSQLARANALFEAVYSTGYIFGPAVAGILSTLIGPGPTLAIDAVSFLLSGLGLFFVRRQILAPTDRPDAHILADIREGIAFIVHHPTLRSSIGFWGVIQITTAPLVPALTVYITRDLAFEDWVLGPAPRRVRRGNGHRCARDLATPSRHRRPRVARWQPGPRPRAHRHRLRRPRRAAPAARVRGGHRRCRA